MERRGRSGGWGSYGPYVSAEQRRRLAAREAQRAEARGEPLDPVRISGRAIALSPWGRAWCDHIEGLRDYASRLPRGRTYVRNGSVVHLEIRTGEIRARVIGSELYEQRIEIEPCGASDWQRVRERCAGGIGSLIELLEGRISSEVMAAMTTRGAGLLPEPAHVRMTCSCPDWASLCKHLASVLYGVGARLDQRPELLFTLRGVDPGELVDRSALLERGTAIETGMRALDGDLASVFGIELDEEPRAPAPRAGRGGKAQPPSGGDAAAGRHARPVASPPADDARPSASPGTSHRRKVARHELLHAGVPAGTISTWLHQGILRPSGERGVYLHTRESRARLARYA